MAAAAAAAPTVKVPAGKTGATGHKAAAKAQTAPVPAVGALARTPDTATAGSARAIPSMFSRAASTPFPWSIWRWAVRCRS